MPLKTQPVEEPTLNLTAMLDVMFLLIIFFVLGSRFIDEERTLDLRVPEVVDRGTLAVPTACKEVRVARDGRIMLDASEVSLEELTRRLAAERRGRGTMEVLVRGDGQGEFQHVAAVLTACKQAGVRDLGIAVRAASP